MTETCVRALLVAWLGALTFSAPAASQTLSPLLSREYTVLPPPQKVQLRSNDFEFTPEWRRSSRAGHADLRRATQLLAERFQFALKSAAGKAAKPLRRKSQFAEPEFHAQLEGHGHPGTARTSDPGGIVFTRSAAAGRRHESAGPAFRVRSVPFGSGMSSGTIDRFALFGLRHSARNGARNTS